MSYVQICPYTLLRSIETQLLDTKFELLKINLLAECTKTTCYCARWKWIGLVIAFTVAASHVGQRYRVHLQELILHTVWPAFFRVSYGVFAKCCDAKKMWPGSALMCVQSKPAIRCNFRDRCVVLEFVFLCVHCGLYPPAGLQFVLQTMKCVELKMRSISKYIFHGLMLKIYSLGLPLLAIDIQNFLRWFSG